MIMRTHHPGADKADTTDLAHYANRPMVYHKAASLRSLPALGPRGSFLTEELPKRLSSLVELQSGTDRLGQLGPLGLVGQLDRGLGRRRGALEIGPGRVGRGQRIED